MRYAIVCTLILCGAVTAQDPQTAPELRVEIAKLEARALELRVKLAKIEPKAKIGARKPRATMNPDTLKVGDLGGIFSIQPWRVIQVVSANEMVIQAKDGSGPALMLLESTAGIADGRMLELKGVHEVVGVKRSKNGRSFLVIQAAE